VIVLETTEVFRMRKLDVINLIDKFDIETEFQKFCKKNLFI